MSAAIAASTACPLTKTPGIRLGVATADDLLVKPARPGGRTPFSVREALP
jgi:hypothetical protein